jgi:glutathione S-transferase
MKLYYSPGACSLAPHILLRETGSVFDLVKVDLAAGKTASGQAFKEITTKGSVPLLELDNGERLSEGPVIARYICDKAGRSDLMPAPGTMARYRVEELQNFITSELHKSFSPLFSADTSADTKAWFAKLLQTKLAWISEQLGGKPYLTGDTFTAADAYLFTVASWAHPVKLDIKGLEPLQGFMARVKALPSVQAAMRAEGLIA